MDACGALPRATAFAAKCSILQAKRACWGFRRCGCAGESVLDFGSYGVELDLQWIDSFIASSCPCCSSRPSFSSGTCWGRA